eukprot:81513-Chlamydomonas_euryale.AAC.2
MAAGGRARSLPRDRRAVAAPRARRGSGRRALREPARCSSTKPRMRHPRSGRSAPSGCHPPAPQHNLQAPSPATNALQRQRLVGRLPGQLQGALAVPQTTAGRQIGPVLATAGASLPQADLHRS